MPKHRIFIASPLEAEHVDTIRAAAPAAVDVVYEPDLLPPTRYVGDHVGAPFVRDDAQRRRWWTALADAEILWDLPPSPEDAALAKHLKWIQTTSTGVGPSVRALGLQNSGIVVTTARGVHAGPLAEFVFMALLAHFRGLRHLIAEQQAHRWIRYCGEPVAGRTICVIGGGDLARGIATVARALRMRVLAVVRDPAKARGHAELFDGIHGREGTLSVLSISDAVVMTVPHTPDTEGMMDAAAFAAMQPAAAFINIGRGQTVDQDAMIAALRGGRLGFVALDVAAAEPLPPESPLWDMPNVLISPHSASTVTGENARITEIFVHNLRCFLDGRVADMKNRLNTDLLY